MLLFCGFGVLSRLNSTSLVALFFGAFSVASAVLLILELNQPFTGLVPRALGFGRGDDPIVRRLRLGAPTGAGCYLCGSPRPNHSEMPSSSAETTNTP